MAPREYCRDLFHKVIHADLKYMDSIKEAIEILKFFPLYDEIKLEEMIEKFKNAKYWEIKEVYHNFISELSGRTYEYVVTTYKERPLDIVAEYLSRVADAIESGAGKTHLIEIYIPVAGKYNSPLQKIIKVLREENGYYKIYGHQIIKSEKYDSVKDVMCDKFLYACIACGIMCHIDPKEIMTYYGN